MESPTNPNLLVFLSSPKGNGISQKRVCAYMMKISPILGYSLLEASMSICVRMQQGTCLWNRDGKMQNYRQVSYRKGIWVVPGPGYWVYNCIIMGGLYMEVINNIYMSTLAAARADNFYYSKNYDPSKVPPKKSQLAQDKPFKVVQGQRVGGSKVRYETPFHVRCQSCQNMIAKGVRFNSIKTWVDNFHSTKIYEFRMKCPHCPQKFVVRTDPENCQYIYVSGARRIFQAADCKDESRIRDESIQEKVKQNPLFKLEVQYNDRETYGQMEETIEKLKEQQDRGNDDFQLNRMLRKQIKKSKQIESQYYEEKREKNLFVPLLAKQEEDEQKAQKVQFKRKMIKKEQKLEKEKNERDRLKDKLKNLHPSFKKILKKQIKTQTKPQKHLKYSK